MASFKKIKSGWQYRVSYKDGDRYRTKSGNGFSTKREAQIAAARVEDLLNKGNLLDHSIEFVVYFKNWYNLFRKDKFSAKNNKDIEHSIRTAEKFFKNTKILDINRDMYQEFINWYGKDRADATVKKVHVYTKACLLDAFQEGVIHKDPTRKVTAKGTVKAKDDSLKFLSYKETNELIHELKKDIRTDWDSRYMILLSLATGMRFSEVIALKWEDVDFENRTIRINKSFDHVVSKKMVATKSDSSRRTISIDKDTSLLLKEYKIGNGLSSSEYLFMDKHFNHASNTACNKSLKRACIRAGVKKITFHCLRHTHCSLLIYEGINIKYISKRLGHANINITYQIYGHILDEMEQKESEKVDEVMSALFNS